MNNHIATLCTSLRGYRFDQVNDHTRVLDSDGTLSTERIGFNLWGSYSEGNAFGRKVNHAVEQLKVMEKRVAEAQGTHLADNSWHHFKQLSSYTTRQANDLKNKLNESAILPLAKTHERLSQAIASNDKEGTADAIKTLCQLAAEPFEGNPMSYSSFIVMTLEQLKKQFPGANSRDAMAELETFIKRDIEYGWPSLAGREVEELTAEQFRERVFNGRSFSPDTLYVVTEDLDFANYHEPIDLPDQLIVKGQLAIQNCSGAGAAALPDKLIAESLLLSQLPRLVCLPVSIQIAQQLEVIDCPELLSLGKELKMSGTALIKGCPKLANLPGTLRLGELVIEDCNNLRTLPCKKPSLAGNLTVRDCPRLIDVPGWITGLGFCSNGQTREVTLSNTGLLDEKLLLLSKSESRGTLLKVDANTNMDIKTLTPEQFMEQAKSGEPFSHDTLYVVTGNVGFVNDNNPINLPDRLMVQGAFSMMGCSNVSALPDHLMARNLTLSDLPKLVSLPENLKIENDIDVLNCDELVSLGKALNSLGSASILFCPRVEALPEDIWLGGHLHVEGCERLGSLPVRKPQLGSHLTLADCRGITRLPNWIVELGLCDNGATRNVNLMNTGVPVDVLDALRTAESEGMRFSVSMSAKAPEYDFDSMDSAFQFWSQLASSEQSPPVLSGIGNRQQALLDFLARLTGTQDYQNQNTRTALAQRVMNVFALLQHDNQKVREDTMDLIEHAVSSCDDRVILTLNRLEVLIEVSAAKESALKEGNPDKLRAMGRKMMYLEEVNKYARQHLSKFKLNDDIETILAFQIGLRDRLGLPGQTRDMIFKELAQVTQQDLDDAEKEIKAKCTDQALESYLANWDPWKDYQRRHDIIPYEHLPQIQVNKIEHCCMLLDKSDKMVQIGDDAHHHFDYEALCQQYQVSGRHPVLVDQEIDWSKVYRLKELGQSE